MIVDFTEIRQAVLANFKGGEKEMLCKAFADDSVRIMLNTLVPGASIGMHCHETDYEIMYVLSGSGKYVIDGKEERISAGQAHYCPNNHSHSFINDGEEDLIFFAVVAKK